MPDPHSKDVLSRCPNNPVIALDDMPFRCSDIWNAGIAEYDGKFVMLVTIEELEGAHAIYKAVSNDRVNFVVDSWPFMGAETEGPAADYECYGVRDARITHADGKYYVTYTAEGPHGMRVGIAETTDFNVLTRRGYAGQVDCKNGVLLPEKINGRYAMLTRPDAGMSIWLQMSNDLEFWGDYRCVMTPRGGYWDSTRIGAAAPPIRVDRGWLMIYYGEKGTSAGPLVRMGAAILDANDPSKVIGRSNIPLLSPREDYERIGDVPNVVFSCGIHPHDGILNVYYGASDSCICMASAPIEEIVATCFESRKGY